MKEKEPGGNVSGREIQREGLGDGEVEREILEQLQGADRGEEHGRNKEMESKGIPSRLKVFRRKFAG
jgi:hypothetical protein